LENSLKGSHGNVYVLTIRQLHWTANTATKLSHSSMESNINSMQSTHQTCRHVNCWP